MFLWGKCILTIRPVAVVVTYQPDLSTLFKLLNSLDEQAVPVVIVDNGSSVDLTSVLAARTGKPVQLRLLGENRGIAAAQNEGLAWARKIGASHVILFDHDSAPERDMVEKLLACEQSLSAAGYRVASVGPRYMDDRQNNPPPFIRVQAGRLKRCLSPEIGDAVSVDYLIASGCLIPMGALEVVGDMAADLFIDYVDIEWGQRARSMGYENFGCFSAKMAHSLGDEPIRFLGTAYPARSPLRHYYMFRNAVLLYRMRHVPLEWKWADGLRGILRFGFYALFAKPRLQHLKMMVRGVIDGLRGRSGKLVA